MSQSISCPNCGHAIKVDDLFERYEKTIAKIVNGKLAPPRTPGYDVIGDPNDTTYQVKHTRAFNRSQKSGSIRWDFFSGKLLADFYVLFYDGSEQSCMFLLDHKTAYKRLTKRSGMEYRGYQISSGAGPAAWIWDYRVTPETFFRRVIELKSIQQLSMEFTKGFGDA